MKKVILSLSIILSIILNKTGYSANEQFRSIASGNWNSNSTWQMSTNSGSTWIAATKTPNDSSSIITIQSPNTVTVTVNVNADELYVNSGATISINSGVNFTILDGNGTDLTLYSGGTISGAGNFQTQGYSGLIDIRNGSTFNAALKINDGTMCVYNTVYPYYAVFNGPITIDPGATLHPIDGGYYIQANNNVTNNGSLTGTGSTFRFFGANFINNGVITTTIFNFETGSHTLQGTGTWTTTANVLNGASVTLAGNHQLNDLNINSGGTFNLSSFKLSMTASNPIINNGTFTASTGSVEYNGTSSQNISAANITYNKLRINNSAGTILSAPVTVNDTLSVVLGDLDLNGNVLTVSSTGYLTETSGNTVKGTAGYITTTRTLNAPSSLNVGGFGAVLTTASNLGSTEIRRGHTVQNGLSGNTSIQRYFDILPTTNSGLNATLVYKYDDSELNGKPEAFLSLFRSTNSGTSWTARGGVENVAGNFITLNNIDAFSRWSAGVAVALAAQVKIIPEGFYDQALNRLNMRDSVRIFLRNNTSPFAIVDSAKSVIDSNTFTGSFLFQHAPSGRYYLQVKHRNLIQTWSKDSGEVYTVGNSLNYDFTTGASQAYGSNLVQVGTKFCIYSGDVDQNEFVDLSDILIVENDATNFVIGYANSDLDGNRITDLSDLLISFNNAEKFVISIHP